MRKESQLEEAPANRDRLVTASIDRTALVSWLFLIGSLVFTIDSLLEIAEEVSVHSLLHLFASILFTIGSILFIPNGQSQ